MDAYYPCALRFRRRPPDFRWGPLIILPSWRISFARPVGVIRRSRNGPGFRNASVRKGSSDAPTSIARISGSSVSAASAERSNSNTLPSWGEPYPHRMTIVALGPFGSGTPVTSQVYRAFSGMLAWMMCFIGRSSSEVISLCNRTQNTDHLLPPLLQAHHV